METQEIKGFRKNKDLTKKQIVKQQSSNEQDMQKLFAVCTMLTQRNQDLVNRVAQLESRLDVILPVIEFQYSGLVKTLTGNNILTEAALSDAIEEQRVAYMQQCESETDRQLNLTEANRPAADGDVVIVGFSSLGKDGVQVAEMSTNYFMTTVGPTALAFPQLMPSLAAAIKGMTAGETKEGIEVIFPEDYNINPKVAGQTLKFSLTLHRVKEKKSNTDATTAQ